MTLEKIFDTIARVITSMGAVLTVMLTTITSMVFFSHTLFGSVFPISMDTWEKSFATWLMALSWEATVLITTVNVKHVNRHIPALMAVCSGLIVLFFIQAFDGTQDTLILVERWFIGILAATLNYIYADLFYAKWVERVNLIERPMMLNELHSRVDQLQSALDQSERQLIEQESKLNELAELQRFKAKISKDLICPHCKEQQEGYGSLQAHKGRCKSNPNSRGK